MTYTHTKNYIKRFLIITILILVAGIAYHFKLDKTITPKTIISTNFEECAAEGNPIMESYPAQCRNKEGTIFVQQVLQDKAYSITYTNSTKDMITVSLPFPGAVVGKDFSVIGKARGNWFFEASFPIEVVDESGKTLATGIGQAIGDWMTTEFVNFKADIKIPANYIGEATLILKKDNPSGEASRDASISFPIVIEY